jgi:hypothetical protein
MPDLLPAVPAIFKTFPNWVTYEAAEPAEKKAPIVSGTKYNASPTDPTTWVSYEIACSNIAAGKGFSNLGFVTAGERAGYLAALDIDGCRDTQTAAITEWAQRILDFLGVTYVEITPSKTGIRVWFIAVMPKTGVKHVYHLDTRVGHGDKVQVEAYGDARYFTMSGNPHGQPVSDVISLDSEKVASLFALLSSIAEQYPPVKKDASGEFVPRETKSKNQRRIRLVPNSTGGFVSEYVPPDEGFKKLFEAVRWEPFIRRVRAMEDSRFADFDVKPGAVTYCPMPNHPNRGIDVPYKAKYFGAIAGKPELVKCLGGCEYSGDLIKTIFEFDNGEEGGSVGHKNMYEAAKVVCTEEGLEFEDFFPAENQNSTVPNKTAVEPEDMKGTSLLIFKSPDDTARAVELGFNSLIASDFKPPLDPVYNRAVLCGANTDELLRNISASMGAKGAIFITWPHRTMDTEEYLNLMLAHDGVQRTDVRKPRTKWVEVPADAGITIAQNPDTQLITDVSSIPAFDSSVMDGSIYGKFAHLATKGTTLQPQYAYQVARLAISMLIIGRVGFENLANIPPLRRIVFIGETGSGKGAVWTRAHKILTMNGKDENKNFKYSDSIDSGVGLKDMFFDDPVGLPVMVYIDEVDSLGHKSADKKNPDILDTMGELANKTIVSRTLSTHGRTGPKIKASKTRSDAYLFWLICAPNGMTFMCATAGRKSAGFNDRNIPVFGVPVVPGNLPEIPMDDIVAWWVEAYKLQSMVGTKSEPGTVTMKPDARAIVESFWNAQPRAIQTKVRFKEYLLLDSYLNAIGRGCMTATVEDVENAIKDCKRELATRAACFQEEAASRVGFYYSSMKRLTAKMAEEIRKAGPNADPFEYGMSEADFERATRAYANNEPEEFGRAWKNWLRHLDKLEPQKLLNGRTVTRYVPAKSERD